MDGGEEKKREQLDEMRGKDREERVGMVAERRFLFNE